LDLILTKLLNDIYLTSHNRATLKQYPQITNTVHSAYPSSFK